MTIRILIADDHEILRRGLTLLIDGHQDMKVIGTAANGAEAVEKTFDLKPDIVLMDISMPEMDGLTATRRIKKQMPNVEILILTMLDDPEYLLEILDSGASGYLLKTYGDSELFSAIRSIYSKSPYLYPHAMKHLMNNPLSQKPLLTKEKHKSTLIHEVSLTSREKDVLYFISKGYSNKEMAEKLAISVKTVESHKSRIMDKLQMFTRRELVEYAVQLGLLDRGGGE